MVILPSSTKIMEQMYFEDCDYKTYDFVSSHSFLLNFVLAGWSVLFHWLADFLSVLPAPSAGQRVWRATPWCFLTPYKLSHTSVFANEFWCFRTLSIKWCHQSLIWWIINTSVMDDETDALLCVSVQLHDFFISQVMQYPQWRKSPAEQINALQGVLAVDRIWIDWRPFKDNVPLFSQLLLLSLILQQSFSSVSSSSSLSRSLPVVQLIMVLVFSSRAWHPN